ncbi:MAG: alpha/beta fold hydrolase, partial [Thermoleophilia bacterium]
MPLLDGRTRVALDLPLGSHVEAMPRGADLSPPALADLIADALAALELEDVTIVGNDTGGGLTQILATRNPARIGRVVLTSCDAFDNFPPRFFRIVFAPARLPGGLVAGFAPMRIKALRRLPIAYGWLSKRPVEPAVSDSWV